MTKELNFLEEHLKMEVMRLKELGFGEAHCEAAISVGPSLAHQIVQQSFHPASPQVNRNLPDRNGAILHVKGK